MEQTSAAPRSVPLVDYPAARERLGGISQATLARLMRRGEIPVVKVLARGLIDPADLDEYIERQKRRRAG